MQRNKKGHPLGTKLIPMGAKTQCNGKKTQCNGIKGPTHMGAEKSFPWEQKNHSHGSRKIIPMGTKNPYRRSERLIS